MTVGQRAKEFPDSSRSQRYGRAEYIASAANAAALDASKELRKQARALGKSMGGADKAAMKKKGK